MWSLFSACLLFEPATIEVVDACCEADVADQDGDGFTVDEGDCDDQNESVNPGMDEICDGVDNDCDGFTDQSSMHVDGMQSGFLDQDQDGFGSEIEWFGCEDILGWSENDLDCDDIDPLKNPSATEVCDGVDNDCDLLIDDQDDSLVVSAQYQDLDGDGFGSDIVVWTCSTEGVSTLSGDCRDQDPDIGPLVEENLYDLIDQNCDGLDIADFTDCGTGILECSEIIEFGSALTLPFQRIEAGQSFDQAYRITRPFVMMSTEMPHNILSSLGVQSTQGAQTLHPATNVRWHDAAYAANQLTKYVNGNPQYKLELTECYACTSQRVCEILPDCTGYRLPTSAEWEYASRAHTKLPFSTDGSGDGDDLQNFEQLEGCDAHIPFQYNPSYEVSDFAWYCGNAPNGTENVAKLLPNPFGLYDMQGNVAEWVQDTESSVLVGDDPIVVNEPTTAVLRGGSFQSIPYELSNALYEVKSRDGATDFIGFRLVRTLPY